MKFYTIFNKKSLTFSDSIFPAINDEVAIRICFNLVNSKSDNLIALIPEDFKLFCVGDFDMFSGEIKPCLIYVCELFSLRKDLKNNG